MGQIKDTMVKLKCSLCSRITHYTKRNKKKVKEKLLFQLTNFGHPIISVSGGNYKNRGELMLKHQHDGVDLRPDYASETLKSLYKIWARPVNIETMVEGVPKILCFDGEEYKEFRP